MVRQGQPGLGSSSRFDSSPETKTVVEEESNRAATSLGWLGSPLHSRVGSFVGRPGAAIHKTAATEEHDAALGLVDQDGGGDFVESRMVAATLSSPGWLGAATTSMRKWLGRAK